MNELKSDIEVQVSKEHYYNDYDSKKRWISYWHQINETLKTEPKTVLEIGVGNKTVSNYLEKMGIEVTTVDIDVDLNPDYICSVTELDTLFQKDRFDTVLCAEVLEHLPFNYFEEALNQIKKVSNKNVILSLPDSRTHRAYLKVPLIKEKNIYFQHPFAKSHNFNGEHYWEIGKKGYDLKSILAIVSKYFVVKEHYNVSEHPYHMFIILEF